MILTFLSHSWKKFLRSVSFGKELVTSLFLGFIGMMMMIYSVGLGFGLNKIITQVLKIEDSATFLNGVLLYYFGIEFMMRYFLQNLPVLQIQPYLHLPIKKSNIAHYLLGKSILHVLNIITLLLFTPFAFQIISKSDGASAGWNWVLAIWFLSLTMHYIVVLFKKQLDDSMWGTLLLTSAISLFGAADYYGWFKLSEISAPIFITFIKQPLSLAIPFFLLIGIYAINFRVFRQSIYMEDLSSKKNDSYGVTKDFKFLDSFGSVGEWINVELKLILRNKRPRNILFLSSFFLLYGLIYYTKGQDIDDKQSLFIFIGIFMTGIFMINYGQFLFSWQGGHFDFTLTQPISMREFVESKYWLLTAVTLICFVLSIPYVYFGWKILLIHAVAAAFNIGVNSFVILNMAMWEPKKIDLSKSSSFNFEGIGAAQWLMGFPILLGPYIIYFPFSLVGNANLGLLAVGVTGLIGIVFRKPLLNYTTARLMKKKYLMAANFRKE